jgi:hypothetical protein
MLLLRLTVGNRAIVVVWIEERQPEIFEFDAAYDALLFERAIGAQLEFITHGNNRLVPAKR